MAAPYVKKYDPKGELNNAAGPFSGIMNELEKQDVTLGEIEKLAADKRTLADLPEDRKKLHQGLQKELIRQQELKDDIAKLESLRTSRLSFQPTDLSPYKALVDEANAALENSVVSPIPLLSVEEDAEKLRMEKKIGKLEGKMRKFAIQGEMSDIEKRKAMKGMSAKEFTELNQPKFDKFVKDVNDSLVKDGESPLPVHTAENNWITKLREERAAEAERRRLDEMDLDSSPVKP